jgi:hypothetical protein
MAEKNLAKFQRRAPSRRADMQWISLGDIPAPQTLQR